MFVFFARRCTSIVRSVLTSLWLANNIFGTVRTPNALENISANSVCVNVYACVHVVAACH